ncbi:hypothetical protein BDP27DRAFT_294655 [Rhodocollybia butyracea]|uniref:Uncharacterized protein n=1 Tax=Rhodocollybia butyracea TaxID=206335 RepID=A0A9P5U0Y5_9AGAR|nr:hypothetical protein BDP27DRAFT_294655 [Rhodocollybia butyracea]
MDAAELARLIRFAARGGIGKATAIEDRVAESSEDLMFIEVVHRQNNYSGISSNSVIESSQDDEITVLMQTPENGNVYWGFCEGVVGKFQARDVRFHSPLKRAKRTFARTVEPIIEKPIIDDSVSSLVLDSRSVKITSKVVDSQGRTQGLLSRTMSGVWSVNPIDSDTMDRVFTVTLNDPLFQHEVLSGIHPCRHPDWNIPSRINILLEMLYW